MGLFDRFLDDDNPLLGLGTFSQIFGAGAAGPLSAIGLGANLAATGFGFGAERRRRDRFEASLLKEADLASRSADTARFAPSEGEAAGTRAATRGALRDLTNRNVLSSSIAPGVVQEAAAPFDLLREERIRGHEDRAQELRLAAANVAAGAPTGGDFAAEAFGEAGSFLGLRAGQEFQNERDREFAKKLDKIFAKPETTESGSVQKETLSVGGESGRKKKKKKSFADTVQAEQEALAEEDDFDLRAAINRFFGAR
jgi:hypothetical protein